MASKSNECPKCGKIYMLVSSLKTHMLSHTNECVYRCTKCHMTFSDHIVLQKHFSSQTCTKKKVESLSTHDIHSFNTFSKGRGRMQKQLKVYRRRFRCSLCAITFSERMELKDHMSSHDVDNSDIHISVDSDKEEKNPKRLSLVTRPSSPNDIIKRPNSSHQDQVITPNNLKNKIIINNYSRVESNTKISSSKSDLQRDLHMDAVCPFCQRTFSVEAELTSHVATHFLNDNEGCIPSETQGISCSESIKDKTVSNGQVVVQNCKNKKVSTSSINVHYPDSMNQKSFTCCKCQMTFSTRELCENHHVSSHSDVRFPSRLEEVDICISRDFKDDSPVSFEEPIQSQSWQAQSQCGYTILYKCLNCPKTFLIKTEIEKHVLTHANDNFNDFIPSDASEMRDCKTMENDKATEMNKSPKLNSKISKLETNDKHPIRVFHKFFKCIYCPLIFLAKAEVENHVLFHTDKNNVDCSVPLESQDNRSAATTSENCSIPSESIGVTCDTTITVFQSYECPVCTTFFSEMAELECHMLSCHKNIDHHTPIQMGGVCSSETYEQSIVVNSLEDVHENYTTLEENVSNRIIPQLGLAYYSLDNAEENVPQNNHQKLELQENFEEQLYNCTICGKKFDLEKKFLDHKRIHGVKRHSCKLCGKSFRANSYLKVHMRVHSDSRPYRCTDCDKTFKSDTALNMHKVVHSSSKPYQCHICDATFKHKNSLTSHGLVHAVDRPFKCEICEKDFKSSVALKGHMKTHIEKCTNEKKFYYCNECHRTYSNEKNYRYHLRLHSGDVPHRCKYCGKGFVMKPFLTQHLRTHTGERPYKCPICEKTFALKTTLRNHFDTHSDKKRYVCHICGVHISQRQTLSAHLKKHSGVKLHKCHLCDKQFFLKSNYRRHLRVHSGERPFQCLMCKKSFKQNAHLKSHIASHKGEKPYHCPICNKCFTYKSSLKNHILTHTTSRPFICTKCGKSFRSKGSLNVHLLTHNAEVRFGCPECGKKFKLKSSLLIHTKKRSDKTSFTCQICMKVFSQRACFHQHKKSHIIEREAIDVDKCTNLRETELKNSEELESIKVTEVMDNFDGHEGIQVHIIV